MSKEDGITRRQFLELAGITLVAAGCAPIIDAATNTPEATSTEAATHTPESTPTPTPDPYEQSGIIHTDRGDIEITGAPISAEGMLSEAEQVIEIDTSLVGKVRIGTEEMDMNYPNINTPITFALHPSLMNKPDDSEMMNIEEIQLISDYWESKYGEGAAERQILAEYMYVHYRAWQRDEGGRFLNERQNTTFEKYLTQVNNGEIDGGHMLRVRVDQSYLQPYDEKIRIFPTDPTVVMFAEYEKEGEPYIGGSLPSREMLFDPVSERLIVVTDVQLGEFLLKQEPIASEPIELKLLHFFDAAYYQYLFTLSQMACYDYCQWGNFQPTEPGQIDIVNKVREETIQILRQPADGNYYDLSEQTPIRSIVDID